MMPWKVDRYNNKTNNLQTATPNYATGVEAFDAAWDNCGQWVKNTIRQNQWGDNENPPAPVHTFKIYVDYNTTDAATMGAAVIARFSYPTGTPPTNEGGDWETNEISWSVRFE
jgi:hypothetical protein